MKKTTFSMILLVCFVSTNLFSQLCLPTSSGNTDFLNWETTPTFTFYLKPHNGAPTYVSSPFFASGVTCNTNIWPYCNNIAPDNDISSADGWRYVKHDFGKPSNQVDCPVFVLYNIYSGILRVFFYKSLNTPANSAVVTLGYQPLTTRTGLLENYTKGAKNAIYTFDNSNKSIFMPNVYVLSQHWAHADFVTQYDPCTCQSENAYNLKLVAALTSSISFTVNGQIKQDVQANQSNGATQAFTTKTGIEGLNIVKSLFGIGAGSAPNQYANIFNTLSSYAGNIGLIVKAADFLIGLFDKGTAPAKVTPLVFNTNLSGAGDINTTLPLQEFPFNNPGSALFGTPVENRPSYNNIMGTFSLLRTPQINVNRYKTYNNTSNFNQDWNMWCDEESGYAYTQVECLQPISWVLNPDAQLSVDELKAAYIIYTNNGNRIESTAYLLECFLSYKPSYFMGNYNQSNCYASNSHDLITRVELKIIGNFSAGNNQGLAFTQTYKVNMNLTDIDYQPSNETPSQNCTAITPSASVSQISNVCNSSGYINRANQFFKAPTDTGVKVKDNAKASVGMDMQIAPNPASNSLFLQYTLKNEGRVKIAIYDLSGKMIKSLATDDAAKEGAYSLQADLTDVASGLYFVVLDVNGKTLTQKLSVMKK